MLQMQQLVHKDHRDDMLVTEEKDHRQAGALRLWSAIHRERCLKHVDLTHSFRMAVWSAQNDIAQFDTRHHTQQLTHTCNDLI